MVHVMRMREQQICKSHETANRGRIDHKEKQEIHCEEVKRAEFAHGMLTLVKESVLFCT